MSNDRILIHFQNNVALSWNAHDVAVLRSVHRIVGNLIGCDVKSPYQNVRNGLPLQLLPEETTLLLQEGIIRLVTNERLKLNPSVEEKNIYEQYKNTSQYEQNLKYNRVRKETILAKSEEIFQGYIYKKEGHLSKRQLRKLKRSKSRNVNDNDEQRNSEMNSNLNEEENKDLANFNDTSNDWDHKVRTGVEPKVLEKRKAENNSLEVTEQANGEIENEIVEHQTRKRRKTTSYSGDNNFNAQLTNEMDFRKQNNDSGGSAILNKDEFISSLISKIPDLTKESYLHHTPTECPWYKENSCTDVEWSHPVSHMDTIRYLVFKDLWQQKFYITTGTNFGGDFLVYPGDPVQCHSSYIAVCVDQDEEFTCHKLIYLGRMGNNVKKTTVLCSVDENDNVKYMSLNFSPLKMVK